MQEPQQGSCPLHGEAFANTCDLCAQGDRTAVFEQIRSHLRSHFCAEDPRAVLLSMSLLGTIDDALAVDTVVGLPRRQTRSRRFLVRPDSVLTLDCASQGRIPLVAATS
jgi:hypothetical protein